MSGCTILDTPRRRHHDSLDRPVPAARPRREILDASQIEAAAATRIALTRLDRRPLSLLSIGLDRAPRDASSAEPFVQTCLCVLRHEDLIGRLDTTRVVALLPDTPAIGARCAAERLRTAVAALAPLDQLGRPPSVSIGIVTTRTGLTTYAALRSRADAKRDDARARGGNRVEG